ncbi:MAG: DUF4911 domain-containing protein [Deltaproteobacteria bacterium]|nr:DUF4911 domain-containing protein [Deltaproteobacteria bacterium]
MINIKKVGNDITRMDFTVPREKIGYYRFILESYEGMGVQTTKRGSSIVSWSVPNSMMSEARSLLDGLISHENLKKNP